MEDTDQQSDQVLGYEIESPNEDTDDQDTSNDDQGVLEYLLGSGPDDLLQLTVELTEVSGDGAEEPLEPILLFDFCQCCGLLT